MTTNKNNDFPSSCSSINGDEPQAGSIHPFWGPATLDAKRDKSRRHQSEHAWSRQKWIDRNSYFYENLKRLLQFIVEPGKRVLNVRCQTGWFLNALRPEKGVGIDISLEMIAVARQLYPQFEYVQADSENLDINETFDYILYNNLEDTVDIFTPLQRLNKLCERHTRLLIYTYNHWWEPVLKWAERFGMKWPTQEPNWLSEFDLRNALHLTGFEWLKTYRIILLPKRIPLISSFLNRFVARLPGIDRLCLINILVARPSPKPVEPKDVSVSIVVPCKNERGNIKSAVERIPDMGRYTEIIFCDDKSTNGTTEKVVEFQKAYPGREIKLVHGPGICKADNVWAGFWAATGDVLMILDGDLTVMPEELPLFFQVIVENKGEFINGSRLVYPLPKQAMKFANILGNKAFSSAFSFLLGQRIKDTLCGTKVFWRSDWKRMEHLIGTWGGKDLWGDYELLFAAAKLNLRIVDLPVHYQERVYGITKMANVFWNGLNMLRFYLYGLAKFKGGY